MTQELKTKIEHDLKKYQDYLEYSFAKVQKINLEELSEQDNETLETLESFSGRFARFSDLAASRYLRFLATCCLPRRTRIRNYLPMNWIVVILAASNTQAVSTFQLKKLRSLKLSLILIT